MNFTRDVVDAADPGRLALVWISAAGERHESSFGQVADRSARAAGTLRQAGIGRGDVVMTLVGNRPEWVDAMLACFRIGAVALPCTLQLRPNDLRRRMDRVEPRLVVADERNVEAVRAAGFAGRVITVPDDALYDAPPAPLEELEADDPALVIFTSGTTGEPRPIRHGQRYLPGQSVQARHWYGAHAGDLCWCTAASGWSKSARNAFIAPWLCGAAALLTEGGFEPEGRIETVERERVNVLCMAPTEYRAVARLATLRPMPMLRHAVAAGEPLDPGVLATWRDAAGIEIHDGYGQTESGAVAGMPIGEPVRDGSMGRPLPGYRLWVERGELCIDPASVPTFFIDAPPGPWRTGDRVAEDEDGYFWFEGRADDVIISSGYRIGPGEVEAALGSHPAVAEAAAVPAPDEIRGSVVRAVVVLHEGNEPSEELARALQEHARAETAPYKYPRIVDFVSELPKTASGKVRRAALREQPGE
jgi:acyl-coenzyme A synthetase/AMP-(fatty) acid ligase